MGYSSRYSRDVLALGFAAFGTNFLMLWPVLEGDVVMKTSGKIIVIVMGILMVASGVYCIAVPGLTFLALGWVIGFNMILDAIGNICTWGGRRELGLADGWTLAGAIASLCFGIILIVSETMQLAVELFVAYTAALWLLLIGLFRIVRSSHLHRIHKEFDTRVMARNWWVVMLTGILMVIVGVMSFMNPAIAAVAIGTMVGVGIFFAGVNLLATACIV